jgi:hypothetical protein
LGEAMCFIELAPLPDMTNRQVIHHGCDDSDKAATSRREPGICHWSSIIFHLSFVEEGFYPDP